MKIEVRNIAKRFGAFTALSDVSLDVAPGEFLALLGPSGSGKTTLLRIIAGLEFPDEGAVFFNGDDALPRHVRERNVGFVFQHYALFRHMTVFDNVAFGFRVKKRAARPSKAEIAGRVGSLLQLVQMDGFADRYPTQLSGGQRQRVALARALAIDPKVLLLDEPFGALDAKVRKELRRWLRQLHDRMNLSTVFVTHDQDEALELADRVIVMNRGAIEQSGTPDDVYDHPRTPFVYEFLGNANRLSCVVRGGKAEFWDSTFDVADYVGAGETIGTAYVRPHDIDIFIKSSQMAQPAIVRHVSASGAAAFIELAVDGQDALVEAEISRDRQAELGLRPGQAVFVAARKARVFVNGSREP